MATLRSMWTYPVKGGPGRSLEDAEIGPQGLPEDRRWAVPSGRFPLTGTGWITRRAFRNLAQDVSPDAWSGPLVERGVPLWDAPDTTISVINLATLADISAVTGVEIDPRRFRANLYLDGLPAWAELSWPGTCLRIGEVDLEVDRLIERCRAITVNPDTATRDLRLPALLQSHYGHLNCGVYARVRRPGAVRVGAEVCLGPAQTPVAPLPGWPRKVEVVARAEESPGVTSLWLLDPAGLAHRARPGQHVRILARDADGPVWRCFTVSGTEPDRFRITVRRHGRMGDLLLTDDLAVTGPHGSVVLADTGGPLLLLSAGIGITVTVALLRSLEGTARPVRVLHVDRGCRVALWEEVLALRDRLDDVQVRLVDTAVSGRPSSDDIAAMAREGVGEAFVCGPDGFAEMVSTGLADAGVAPEAIRRERFYSPAPPHEERPAPLPGPFRVRFGDTAATWTETDGTLLELGDGIGVDLPSGCRSGVCGECSQRLISGEVAYLTDPLVPPDDGQVLLCCAVPVSDTEVGTDAD